MAEVGGESFQLANVDKRLTGQINPAEFFANQKVRHTQILEQRAEEVSVQKTDVETFLNSDMGEFLTDDDKKALLSVIDNEHKTLVASLGNVDIDRNIQTDSSPEKSEHEKLLKEFLQELLEILKEVLIPDSTDIALLAMPVVGESTIVARRIEKLTKATGKFMEVLRKYEGKGIDKSAMIAIEKIFNQVAKTAGTDLRGIDEAIALYRGEKKGKYIIKDTKTAGAIAEDLKGIREEIQLINKEKVAVLEIKVGGEGFLGRLGQYYPKEHLGKIEKGDIIAKKGDLLYEIEQFQLYLKTTREVSIDKKLEFMQQYVVKMNELLNAHGMPANETTISGLKDVINNFK